MKIRNQLTQLTPKPSLQHLEDLLFQSVHPVLHLLPHLDCSQSPQGVETNTEELKQNSWQVC